MRVTQDAFFGRLELRYILISVGDYGVDSGVGPLCQCCRGSVIVFREIAPNENIHFALASRDGGLGSKELR